MRDAGVWTVCFMRELRHVDTTGWTEVVIVAPADWQGYAGSFLGGVLGASGSVMARHCSYLTLIEM